MPRSYLDSETPRLSNKDLFRRRPIHMAAGMAVITEYATVDSYVSLLLTALAHGDPVPVAAIYGVLRQGQIQGKALLAVGQTSLDNDDFRLLENLARVVRKASDARDVLAHRIWLYDEQLPDTVVLADPGLFWKSDHHIRVGESSGPTTNERAKEIENLMRSGTQIWTLDDLEQARLSSVHAAVGLSSFRLMAASEDGSLARKNERQSVLDAIEMAL